VSTGIRPGIQQSGNTVGGVIGISYHCIWHMGIHFCHVCFCRWVVGDAEQIPDHGVPKHALVVKVFNGYDSLYSWMIKLGDNLVHWMYERASIAEILNRNIILDYNK
jgi:hypothetical protein